MIPSQKVEEWIGEIEIRPQSAAGIIRAIAGRLADLDRQNEALAAENILLRSGQKVEEYENRIANLEYQLALLKKLVGGEAPIPTTDLTSLLVYTRRGQVLRIELDLNECVSGKQVAGFGEIGQAALAEARLLLVSAREELLFLFDSGRTARLAVDQIPVAGLDRLDWNGAYRQDPTGGEELAAVLPVGRMSLFEFCIQASRRGFVKKIPENFFESHLTKDFIGSGVILAADRSCCLTFCDKNDLYVMASHEGVLFSIGANRLLFTIEEALRLSPSDYILAGFSTAQKSALLVVTRNGKAIYRDINWLEPAESFRTRGQMVISSERRAKGIRLVGADAVNETDWVGAIFSNGSIRLYQVEDLSGSGSLFRDEESSGGLEHSVLGFTTFSAPAQIGKNR